MKNSKYKFLIVSVVAFAAIGCYFLFQARADSLTANIYVSENCVSSVNGASSSNVSVVAGNTILTVNNSSMIVQQSISGPGVPAGTQVDRNTKTTNGSEIINLGSLTSPITITFSPIPSDYYHAGGEDNYCPLGSSPSPSYLVINPVAAPAPPAAPAQTAPRRQSSTTPAPTITPPAEQAASAVGTTPPEETTSDSVKINQSSLTATLKETKDIRKPVIAAVSALLVGGIALASYMNWIPFRKFWLLLRRKLRLT